MTFDQIFPMALRLTRHRQDAEDVAQEALIRLWKHPEWFPATTVKNAYLDFRRKRQRRVQPISIEDKLREDSHFDIPASDDPYREVAAKIELSRITCQLPEEFETLKGCQLCRARKRLEERCSIS